MPRRNGTSDSRTRRRSRGNASPGAHPSRRAASAGSDGLNEYAPNEAFSGIAGRTIDQSSPAWPQPMRARKGAPNVLFIVLDDTGFGQLGCYGSPIRTPNIDALAAGGLRYTNMHTTALCSPTRSCILTGRNHHSNNMAGITEISTGFPGYNGIIPFEHGFLSEMLQQHGYNAYAVGKWHLTPAEQMSAAGPYDRWPIGRGFERYYGFLGGDTHQYYPDLVYDNHQVDPPKTPEEGYHLTPDMTDKAIQFINDAKQLAPDKPFFLYYAPGAMHAPHHAPKAYIDRYKGAFDDGWDEYRKKVFARQKQLGIVPRTAQLSRHDPDVQDWRSLPEKERRLYARMMEVFAGFLEHTDEQIGRLITALRQAGQLRNTLVMLISDNGASAEGGPSGSVNENRFFNNVPESLDDNIAAMDELGGPKYFNHYPWGWTFAGNTPFRRWKRETYRGGISDPFIVHWPARIAAKGEIRNQFVHAIDMVPTVLDALGVSPPDQVHGVAQAPIEGVSFAHTFDGSRAATKHIVQYFEMLGHRSLYYDGWRAVCPVPGPSFKEARIGFGQMEITREKLIELDAKNWELYHVAEDIAENDNLATTHRDKLIEMIGMWYAEAGKYKVLPIDSRATQRLAEPRPQLAPARERYVYHPETSAVPENVAVRVFNRRHTITAVVETARGNGEGVLLSYGSASGGYSLFLKDHRLHYVHNYVGAEEFHIQSTDTIRDGKHDLGFEFTPTGKPDIGRGLGVPAKAQLFVDGKLVGEGDIPHTMPITTGLGGGLIAGKSPGSSVTSLYHPPFPFTGLLREVIVDVSGEHIPDEEAQMKMAMAHQ